MSTWTHFPSAKLLTTALSYSAVILNMQNGLWLCYLKQLGFFFTNQLTEDFYFKFYPRSILLKSGDETIEFLQHFFLSFSRYILRTGFRCDSDYRGLCDIRWWYCLTVKVFCKWRVWGWVFFPLFTLELGLREQAGEWELKQAMVSWKIFPESHITYEVQGCKGNCFWTGRSLSISPAV